MRSMEHDFEKNTAAFFKEFEKYNRNLFQISCTLLNTEDVELAPSPKDLVFEEDTVRLFRFRPKRKDLCPVPLLICYALANRETMMDLEEGRSLIRNMLEHGLDIYSGLLDGVNRAGIAQLVEQPPCKR